MSDLEESYLRVKSLMKSGLLSTGEEMSLCLNSLKITLASSVHTKPPFLSISFNGVAIPHIPSEISCNTY